MKGWRGTYRGSGKSLQTQSETVKALILPFFGGFHFFHNLAICNESGGHLFIPSWNNSDSFRSFFRMQTNTEQHASVFLSANFAGNKQTAICGWKPSVDRRLFRNDDKVFLLT